MSTTQLSAGTARDRLDSIIRQEAPIEQQATDALDLGTEYLEADVGVLVMRDPSTEAIEQITSTDSTADGLPALDELVTAGCHPSSDQKTQVALHNFSSQSVAATGGHHATTCHDDAPTCRCYLYTPLIVDGTHRGEICFVTHGRRCDPFGDGELLFAELTARLLGHELKCDRKEQRLRNQANLTTVLNRVLRHNLRNKLTVIRGHTQAMADQHRSTEHSERILETADQLTTLGHKARDLESVLDQTAPRETTDLTALAERVTTSVTNSSLSVSVTADGPEQVTIPVRPSFERVLTELLHNAVTRGGEEPTVGVAIDATDTDVTMTITDDGPGLPKQERVVLETEAETPLVHGSGLGLWLVHWIVTNHGGTITPRVTDAGTTMTVSIPRQAALDGDAAPMAEPRVPKLTRARDQYRAVFEESNDAMIITDDDGRILDANATAATVYGVEAAALQGRYLSTFLPDDFDFAGEWASFQTEGHTRDTMTIVNATGAKRTVEYAATADVVPGQHLLVAHDITDRIQREAELQMKTRAMDNAPIGITISDPSTDDNPLIYANDKFCEQVGYEESAVLGRNCRFPQGEATDPDTVSKIRHAVEAAEPITETLRNYRKDGTVFWNRLTVAPVTNGQGTVTNYVGFQEDVTALVEHNQEIASALNIDSSQSRQ
jgi:PAS domain S-box-containing protein